MKKTQVALAALALVASSAALAQVTVSGYAEAGVQSTSSGTTLVGGGLNINHLAFSAKEDLDGGLKAGVFSLMRYETTTGALTRPGTTGNGTFFEIAHVNLSGAFGTVELGRTVDSFWGNGIAAFDVTGGANFGSAVASALNLQTSKIFVDNSVHYVSPNMNGLSFGATYILNTSTTGSTIGSATKNDFSLAGSYAAGALTVGAGTMKSDLTKGSFAAAGYDFGIAKVNVIYQDATSIKSMGANTLIPLGGPLSVTAGYYKDSGSGTFLQGAGASSQLGLLYDLSKRTRLYVNYQNTSGLLQTNLGLSTPNANSPVGAAWTVGVGHSF